MTVQPDDNISLSDRGREVRQSFLKYPGENSEVDYKAAGAFKEGEEFALKIVKHILGMCNSGGGYLVIGYKENNEKVPEAEKMDSSVLVSYDPSKIAQYVEKFTIGTERISIAVHKDPHPDTGMVYPIIQVFGFAKRPLFCKSTKGPLSEGALYVRIASARTINVATPDDWDNLIDLCVERRQEETLGRFASILREVGLPSLSVVPPKLANEAEGKWLEERRSEVEQFCKSQNRKFAGIEICHWIDQSEYNWSLSELLDAAAKAAQKKTGWPIGLLSRSGNNLPSPQEDGIKVVIDSFSDRFDYWYLREDGRFYLFRTYEENPKRDELDEYDTIYFDIRIWRAAEAIDHCIALYQALSVKPSEKVQFWFRHNDLNDRHLTASNPGRAFTMWDRVCKAEVSTWNYEGSIDLLQTEKKNLVIKICKKLFNLFDFWEPSNSLIEGVMTEYFSSRI